MAYYVTFFSVTYQINSTLTFCSFWYSEADDMTLKLNLVYEELNNRDKLLQKKKREVTKDLIIVD